MKQKILVVIATIILLLSITLSGCSGGSTVTVTNTTTATTTTTLTTGVSQADYDGLQTQLTKAQADKAAAQTSLQAAEAQIAALKAQYEFTGGTLADIAKRLVANYHATHVYSITDYFICGDMASEVWNMLKAQGISSVIVIGNVDNAIGDILQSNHAWVLATVDNGDKLALETTAGVAYKKAEKPLYYHGWTFNSPTDLKAINELKREYNVRVEFRNLLATETNAAASLYNNASNQEEADKYLTLYNKLLELKNNQETKLLQLQTQINGLATILN
jgi:hypothetical protein